MFFRRLLLLVDEVTLPKRIQRRRKLRRFFGLQSQKPRVQSPVSSKERPTEQRKASLPHKLLFFCSHSPYTFRQYLGPRKSNKGRRKALTAYCYLVQNATFNPNQQQGTDDTSGDRPTKKLCIQGIQEARCPGNPSFTDAKC